MLSQQRDIKTLQKEMRTQQAKALGPTLGEYFSQWELLPSLRGYWPMSSHTQGAGNLVYDLSGQGRSLTRNGPEMRNLYNNLIPYADFNGTSDNLSRADEADLDITDNLTLLGWFYFDSITGTRPLISKWGTTAATRSYNLTTNGGVARVALSTGAAVTTYDGTSVNLNAWNFVAGIYTPSTTVVLYVNGTETSNVTAVAALGNSTSPFRIGNDNDANFLDGRASICAICNYAIPKTTLDYYFNRSRPFFQV